MPNEVVVLPIELTFLISEQLQVFGVSLRDSRHSSNSVNDTPTNGIIVALIVAPGVLRRPKLVLVPLESAVEIALAHILGPLVSHLTPQFDKAFAFFRRYEGFHGHHPGLVVLVDLLLRGARKDCHLEPEIGSEIGVVRNSLEHGIQIAGTKCVSGIFGYWASVAKIDHLASAARGSTVELHIFWIRIALPLCCPIRAILVTVLALLPDFHIILGTISKHHVSSV
mmetsp:Transcript_7892/g.23331  ORF Transcript_7892/g.23331 Transcript_7892/m.23331 type:complete len:225 (-) Transcript_7892:790-1464(-)